MINCILNSNLFNTGIQKKDWFMYWYVLVDTKMIEEKNTPIIKTLISEPLIFTITS